MSVTHPAITVPQQTIPFLPGAKDIADITRSNPAVVETTAAHGYSDGLYVRILLPGNFGMEELNKNIYLITVLSQNTFSIPVDSRNYAPFALGSNLQEPQVIPVGEIANTLVNAERNSL